MKLHNAACIGIVYVVQGTVTTSGPKVSHCWAWRCCLLLLVYVLLEKEMRGGIIRCLPPQICLELGSLLTPPPPCRANRRQVQHKCVLITLISLFVLQPLGPLLPPLTHARLLPHSHLHPHPLTRWEVVLASVCVDVFAGAECQAV